MIKNISSIEGAQILEQFLQNDKIFNLRKYKYTVNIYKYFIEKMYKAYDTHKIYFKN